MLERLLFLNLTIHIVVSVAGNGDDQRQESAKFVLRDENSEISFRFRLVEAAEEGCLHLLHLEQRHNS